MKFVLDENFPKSAISYLEGLGHRCIDIRGTELEGGSDVQLLQLAFRESAVMLTTDRDFFHTLAPQFPDHSGIVVIALKQPNRESILQRLTWLLENIEEPSFPGRAFQLRDVKWVCTPPLSAD